MKQSGRLLWFLVGMLLLGLIASIGFKVAPLLKPTLVERALLTDCDLRAGACETRFDAGVRVWLDIQPRGIPTVRPLQVLVEIQGLANVPTRVSLDFSGVEMNMGYNRVVLKPITRHLAEPGMADLETPGAGQQPSSGSRRDDEDPLGPGGRQPKLRYVGEAMLPVCVRDQMTWEALVLVETAEGLLGAPFRFETLR